MGFSVGVHFLLSSRTVVGLPPTWFFPWGVEFHLMRKRTHLCVVSALMPLWPCHHRMCVIARGLGCLFHAHETHTGAMCFTSSKSAPLTAGIQKMARDEGVVALRSKEAAHRNASPVQESGEKGLLLSRKTQKEVTLRLGDPRRHCHPSDPTTQQLCPSSLPSPNKNINLSSSFNAAWKECLSVHSQNFFRNSTASAVSPGYWRHLHLPGHIDNLFNSTLRDALPDTLLLVALSNPVLRRNLWFSQLFSTTLGNWHVDDLLGSPSPDSVLRHHLWQHQRTARKSAAEFCLETRSSVHPQTILSFAAREHQETAP